MAKQQAARCDGPQRRLLIVLGLLSFGGAERLAMTIAADQIARGHSVDIMFLNDPKDVTSAIPPEARVINLNAPRIRNALWPLVRYLKSERPGAVLASVWPLTTLTIIANMLAGSPSRVIVSDHDPLSIQYSGWGRLHRIFLRTTIWLTYSRAAARVAVSKGVAKDIARLAGIGLDDVDLIYNPISFNASSEAGRRVAAGAWQGCDGKRILTAARLSRKKNHKLLITAFAKVLEKREARLVILGKGELEAETLDFIAGQRLAGKAVLAGHVDDTAAWYESADLFVLSSDYEGFGNVIAEAMASGLPVVSTDCCYGPAEILDGGRYGRLVPVGDVDALAAAILAALDEATDAAVLKRRAVEISGSNSLDKYSRLFHPAIAPARPTCTPLPTKAYETA